MSDQDVDLQNEEELDEHELPRNECRVCLTDDVLEAPRAAGEYQHIYCRACKALCVVDSRGNRTWYALQGYVVRA